MYLSGNCGCSFLDIARAASTARADGRHVRALSMTPWVRAYWPPAAPPETKVICVLSYVVTQGAAEFQPACYTEYGQQQRLKDPEWKAWYDIQ